MLNKVHRIDRPSLQFWLLSAFICLVFLTGGASRIDVQSLIILNPASVFACALACLTLRKSHFVGRGWILWGFIGVFVLTLLHLVPLPPSIWHALPGRADLIEVDQLVGLQSEWRPLTLSPANGWHALASLMTPLAIMLFGIQLNRQDLQRTLPLLIVLASLSGLLGVLQVISNPTGPLYFYRITNNGSAVGLFANRNHAATLLACLLPMLAVFASTTRGTDDQIKSRILISAAIAIVLVPLILVTGSRSGLFGALIGLILSALIYRRPVETRKVRRGDKTRRFGPAPILISLALLSIGFLTVIFSRAVAIDRLFGETAEISRADYWGVSLELFWKYFPWGSGSGSFVEAFLIAEPNSILNAAYVNHAHNDLIETGLTFGVPGLLFLVVGVTFIVIRSLAAWHREEGRNSSVLYARAATAVLLILAVASLTDYPLRTPIMMALLSICLLWLTGSAHANQNGRRSEGQE